MGKTFFCSQCGAKLVENSKFCSECGTKVVRIEDDKNEEMDFVEVKTVIEQKDDAANQSKQKSKSFIRTMLEERLKIAMYLLPVAAIVFALASFGDGNVIASTLHLLGGVLIILSLFKRCRKKAILRIAGIAFVIIAFGFMVSNVETNLSDKVQDEHLYEDDSENKDDYKNTNQDSGFTEEWYKTYTYFTQPETGDTLEIGWDDEDVLAFYVNGMGICYCSPNSYVRGKEGEYVYNDEAEEAVIKYYPEDGNYLIVLFAEEERTYYPVDEMIEEETFVGSYYVTDTVVGTDLKVHPWFAYTERSGGYLWVKVLCSVYNCSGTTLTFNTPNYFSINNNGLLQEGYCDYDYVELAAEAEISTWICFTFPENANTYLTNMTMYVENNEISLADKPQYGEERNCLEGFYYLENSNTRAVIEKLADGRYQIIKYFVFGGVEIHCFDLYDDNTFVVDGNHCTWKPDECSFTDDFAGHTYYKR
ncbi:MAG: zinc ribbon domain-containing protein [Lachnospiraceae bacterium]|nr:zinc ribbon domain-containing protein [Lachnospiraceae bacterium]